MKNSRVYQLSQLLLPPEVRLVRQALQRNRGKRGQHALELFQALLPPRSDTLDKADLRARMGLAERPKEFRQVEALVSACIREVLVQAAMKQEPGLEGLLLLRELRRRQLSAQFDQIYEECMQNLATSGTADQQARMRFELTREAYMGQLQGLAPQGLALLPAMMQQANLTWAYETAALACDALGQEAHYPDLPPLWPPADALSAYIARQTDQALLRMYLLHYQLHHAGEWAASIQLKETLMQQHGQLGPEHAGNFLNLLFNFFVRMKISSGSSEAAQELADLYAWGWEQGLLDRRSAKWKHLINLVTALLQTGQTQKARGYLNTFLADTPVAYAPASEEASEAVRYCEGLLALYEERYSEALQQLSYRYRQPWMRISARVAHWQALYSRVRTQDPETQQFLANLIRVVQRSKDPSWSRYKPALLNTLYLYERLAAGDPPEVLADLAARTRPVTDLYWFRMQIK
ncbi:MAG: hypothetical protein NW241_15095 [Bacteroidia bacterium]|nr:hypothetical protein [Bacteroidia bacterium]